MPIHYNHRCHQLEKSAMNSERIFHFDRLTKTSAHMIVRFINFREVSCIRSLAELVISAEIESTITGWRWTTFEMKSFISPRWKRILGITAALWTAAAVPVLLHQHFGGKDFIIQKQASPSLVAPVDEEHESECGKERVNTQAGSTTHGRLWRGS